MESARSISHNPSLIRDLAGIQLSLTKRSPFGHVILGTLAMLVLAGGGEDRNRILGAWLGLLFTAAVRCVAWWWLNTHAQRLKPERATSILIWISFLSALWWGALPLVFLIDLKAQEHFIVILMIAGIAATGVAVQSAILSSSILFLFTMLAPLAICAAIAGHATGYQLSFVTVFYFAFLMKASRELHRLIAESLLLRYERSHLVADLRQANDELANAVQSAEAARAKAEEASRAKSDFLAKMSHELRTPLNGILGVTSLLLSNDSPATGCRDEVRIVNQCSEHLLAIINDILDISKVEAGKLSLVSEPFDLEAAVRSVWELLAPIASARGIQFDVSAKMPLPRMVRGDETRLRQVITNLAGNALKFTPPSGSVSIRLGFDEQESSVVVQVRDTGPGIAPEYREQIFEAFKQGDSELSRVHGGTGLGLTIAARLVSLMDGRIALESEVGKGSEFRIVIPLGVVESDGSADRASAKEPASTEVTPRLHVLVAEDNPVNQTVVTKMLARLGHTVSTVPNGAEAIRLLASGGFDLVLMDCEMPVMNGFDATATIRAHQSAAVRAVPVIALTAQAMQGDRERCLEAGMNGYLTKPLRFSELKETLSSIANPPVSMPSSTKTDPAPAVQSES